MSTKTAYATALLLAALAFSPCSGQSPFGNPLSDAKPAAHETAEAGSGISSAPIPTGPSAWINYSRPTCCTHIFGGDGPLQTELYMRSGWSVPIDGGVFERTLSTGWAIQGGGRALFMNSQGSAAWAIDLGLSNIWNHGRNDRVKVPLLVLVPQDPQNPVTGPDSSGQLPAQRVRFGHEPDLPGVTIRSLNRTFANLGFGREWYLLRPVRDDGWNWRAGLDGGGRWGVANLELHELRHRFDVIGGVWLSVHSDVEIPFRSAIVQFGFRMECAYTWSDILQLQNKSDLVDINLLLTAGVRF
jgi:hypothetical protein